ncbi:LIC_13076 family protein [Leptospira alstonii]|uniref:Lipoprotein n=2 Tax=Leptospira alstonii TaxID=28452 RepID=T0H4R0_9LEPT|nr:hypothetical protein [Leptospira alstonii]EMJ95703.1 putative lipoprotein [Leptospira alstonii serovar Sichuan str. 79601]EQA80604.1 putative lipoprotein [Leptospira alstonii serovar Pingchang str. 80-412]
MKNLHGPLYSFSVLFRFGFFTLILFFLYSCTTLELSSVRGGDSAKSTLDSQKNSNVSSSSCKSNGKKHQWYVLFGSVPINKVDVSEILPDPNRTYRLILKTTWLDAILSTFLGIAASVTRKTIDVESCDSKDVASAKVPVSTPSEKPEREVSKVDTAKIKEDFIKQNEKQWKEELQEKIHSSLKEELESSWNREVKQSKNLSILFLKSGEIAKGTVTRMDGDGVKLFYKGKERTFRRSDVQRVKFQD